MLRNKERTYWKLQSIGWLLHFISGLILAQVFNYYSTNILILSILSTIVLFIYTHYLRKTINIRKWKKFSIGKLLLVLLSINLLMALLTQIINSIVMVSILDMFEWKDFSVNALIGYGMNTYVVLNGWVLIYFLIYFFNNYKKGEIEKWQLEAALKDSELLSLKAQINPHFIFNCLNNLRALILEDQNKARDMVSSLSEIMRYSFQFSETAFVTLEKELEIIRDYIHLEKIQFEERLTFEMNVDQSLLRQKIPPMLIQLQIENAIKHGITEAINGGEILLDITKVNDMMEIKVVNSGRYQPHKNNKGIGMQNIKNRLELIYNGHAKYSISNNSDSMVESVVNIPIN